MVLSSEHRTIRLPLDAEAALRGLLAVDPEAEPSADQTHPRADERT